MSTKESKKWEAIPLGSEVRINRQKSNLSRLFFCGRVKLQCRASRPGWYKDSSRKWKSSYINVLYMENYSAATSYFIHVKDYTVPKVVQGKTRRDVEALRERYEKGCYGDLIEPSYKISKRMDKGNVLCYVLNVIDWQDSLTPGEER